MNHNNTLEREIGKWVPHESRNTEKAHKRRLSIQRQLGAGAPLEDVRTKILGLHRQSTSYNGNGSYTSLKEILGLGAKTDPKPASETTEAPETEHDLAHDYALEEADIIRRVDELLDECAKTYHRLHFVIQR